MNYVDYIIYGLAVISTIQLLVILIAFSFVAYYTMQDRFESIKDAQFKRCYGDVVQRVANNMRNDADWFSEDPEAYMLLKVYSEGLRFRQHIDEIRKRWRDLKTDKQELESKTQAIRKES